MDKSPPYFFDDPRILFDEPCFKYDGGFDDLCLARLGGNQKFGGGGRSVKRTTKPYQEDKQSELQVCKIKIKSSLSSVNDEFIDSIGYQREWMRTDTLKGITGKFTGTSKSDKLMPKTTLVSSQGAVKEIVSEFKQSNIVSGSVTITSVRVTSTQE